MSIAKFRFNHKSLSIKKKLGKNWKITSKKTYLYPKKWYNIRYNLWIYNIKTRIKLTDKTVFLRDFIHKKLKTLKTSKLKTRKIKSFMEHEEAEIKTGFYFEIK